MTAPALVALAPGGRDPRTVATVKALTELVVCLRPDLRAVPAFLDGDEDSLSEAVDRLVAEGRDEIVVVPLALTNDSSTDNRIASAVTAITARHATLRVHVADTLGVDETIFSILDRRLREALAAGRVRELDGLVLAGPGSSDPVVNASLARAARRWGNRHHLPTVAAFASHAPPAAGEAVRALRADGRRHIAVGMLFLTQGQLADRVTELSLEAGAVVVAEPLGAEPEIVKNILARYAVGAIDLVDLEALFADA